ncbi:hypothetical protein [Paraburkholderia tropica]|uniref:hypothetical protein n=1 Tax=Paraburkholderia tropica TaxID=92647 RepID=UPI003D2B92B1
MEFQVDGYIVHVDEEDAHLFDGRAWRAVECTPGKIYIRWQTKRRGKYKSFYLHRLIMDASKGILVDHRDGDGLNCRRLNLRLGDHVLNARNSQKIKNRVTTSRFKGVNWHKRNKRWFCRIRHSGKQHVLGNFASEVEAAYVYDIASIQFHGDEGRTNFLPFVR